MKAQTYKIYKDGRRITDQKEANYFTGVFSYSNGQVIYDSVKHGLVIDCVPHMLDIGPDIELRNVRFQ